MKAINDHGIAFDAGVENTLLRDLQHFLCLCHIGTYGECQLQNGITGGISLAGKKLVAERFFQVRA